MNLHTRSYVSSKHSANVLIREHIQDAQPTSISYKHSTHSRVAPRDPLSQVTKFDVMLRNLGTCQDYIKKQNVTLSEINNVLESMRLENCFDGRQPNEAIHSRNLIFIDTLNQMSMDSHSGVPLFGITDDPPIRIHLSVKGNQDVFNLRSLPLLSAPAFSSLIRSGFGNQNLTLQFFNEIMQEVLSLMILTDRNLTRVSNLITNINEVDSRRSLYPNRLHTPPLSDKFTFLMKFIHRLTNGR